MRKTFTSAREIEFHPELVIVAFGAPSVKTINEAQGIRFEGLKREFNKEKLGFWGEC